MEAPPKPTVKDLLKDSADLCKENAELRIETHELRQLVKEAARYADASNVFWRQWLGRTAKFNLFGKK